jgi:hypothetical protein
VRASVPDSASIRRGRASGGTWNLSSISCMGMNVVGL